MTQPIINIFIRNFRSLEKTSVPNCGGLNVLIGKNNAGKSSVLAAIPMAISHLAEAKISMGWAQSRPAEQFTNRDTSKPLQVGIEFHLPHTVRDELCAALASDAPQLTKSIGQLKNHNSVSFIFRFVYKEFGSYQYIEAVCLGSLDSSQDVLRPNGEPLLVTSPEAAAELFKLHQSINEYGSEIEAIKSITSESAFPLSAYFRDKRSYPPRMLIERFEGSLSSATRKRVYELISNSDSEEAFKAKAAAQIAEVQEAMEHLGRAEISTPLRAYSGDVKIQPAYITDLCKHFGGTKILTLGERKQPIGRKEASRLLQLKVRRGGPEQLRVVQQTVKALLGVSLDAFQGEGGRDSAEMDVDNFLAEANGAGIRESLRMILDLELEPSDVVLLEEPEVHLHPALEFAIHIYLQEKRKTKQFFLTTHSTNFVDAMTPQHIYLITRDATGVSTCQSLSAEEAPLKLPAELGIRLSTVFMFDKIAFVEGPSDEAVLRELARTLDINIQGAGVAFVHMGGDSKFYSLRSARHA